MNGEIDGKLLDEHGQFLRRLAATLVRDSHRADDVAQEVWLRWFTRTPADRSRPRSWLAAVARGVALNLRRGEGRRAEHEDRQEPGGEHPSTPLDSLRQAERIERVAAAVRALETHYREVILGRHFRGLDVRTLARELGLGEDTLRTRERRALEQLRAKLDREFGGRDAWALVLLPFLEPRPEAVGTPREPALASSLKVAGLLLGVGVLGWIAWPLAPGRGAARAATTGPELSVPSGAERTLAPASPPTSRAPADSGDPSTNLPLSTAPPAEIRGRVRLEGGAPAIGARIGLEGDFRAELGEVYDESGDWQALETVTETDGSFALRFAPPRAYSLMLGVQAEGHADAFWDVAPEPGSLLDLGTLTLERGTTLAGRLVDADGVPVLGDGWHVSVDCSVADDGRGRTQPWRLFAEVEATTGQFLLEHVPAGAARISTTHLSATGPSTPGDEVQRLLLSGAEEWLDLVTPRTPQSDPTRLWLRAYWSGDAFRAPAIEHVLLRGDDGSERRPRAGADATRFEFEGLSAALYTLEITDPSFEPWSRSALEPGTSLRAALRPCSRVMLTVRDAAGALLPAASLTVDWLRENRSMYPLHEPGEFDGTVPLFPGDALLRVRSAGREARLALHGVGHDETRACEVVLNEGASLTGRLVGPDGRGRAYHDVLLLAPAAIDDGDASRILPPGVESSDGSRCRRVVAIVTSDAEGAFNLSAPAERELLLHARRPGNVSVSSARFTLAPDEARTAGELLLPDGVRLAGRLVADTEVPFAGLRLWIAPAASTPGLEALYSSATVSAEGRFELDGLAPGPYRLVLGLPMYQASESGTTSAYGVRASVALGTYELDGSTGELELALHGRLGRLALEVLVDGAPSPHAEVQLQWRERNGSLEARTGGDGRLGPLLLFPGAWSVTVRDPLGAWSWSSPAEVQVEAGVLREETLAIQLTRGTLRLVDARGAPRRDTLVYLAREGGPVFRRAQSDPDGRLELSLGLGLYRLSLKPFEPGALLDWTPTGPAPAELGL
jgi:RNA polymerase sigma-70 factor (ECF subfamily)